MKKTDPDVVYLENLLARYNISEKIPPEIKSYTRSQKSARFKRIMKACGGYTLVSAALSALYFFFKKTGIGMTITKILSAAVLTASISAGGYYAVKKISREKNQEVREKELKQTEKIEETLPGQGEKTAVPKEMTGAAVHEKNASGFRLGIMPLQSGSVSEKNLQRITNSLYGQVTARGGKNFAKILSHRRIMGVKYTAFASIEKIEGYYFVVVKVMDTGSTRIIFNTSRELNSLEDAEKEFKLIYGEVLRLIEKK